MKTVQWIFCGERHGLRVSWKLLAGIAVYGAVFYGIVLTLGWSFGALFAGWGLTNENLIYAPVWAQYVVAFHADFTYGLAYAVSAVAAMTLAGRWTAPASNCVRTAGLAALAGLALGAALTLAVLAFDSMRLEWPLSEPMVSGAQLSALMVMVLGSLSSEMLTKRIVFDPVWKRFGRLAAYGAVCLTALLLSGHWMQPLGALNALLLGLVGCALYERGGLWASAALQIGWGAWTTLLFAWPNSGAASVYRMYTVSEAWLTGGNAGADCGFGVTIGWIIMAAVLLRKDAKRRFAVKKKERITNE